MKPSTKKTLLAMMLGLGLASAAGTSVNAFAADRIPDTFNEAGKNTPAAQVQSVADDTENMNEKYGGCGLSCAGCSLNCF